MKPQRILVTGGAGFIGSHSVDYLLQHNCQVTVLDNLSSGKVNNLDLTQPGLEFIEGDVLEYPLILDLVKNVDAVLHLAAIASVPESIVNPIYTMQVNMQGFLHVLQAVRECREPIRVVYASSAAVYGDTQQLPCRESQVETPLSPYALQKMNCEQYATLFAALFGIKSLGLRYFNVYGERQDPSSPYSGVISRFLDLYHRDEELFVFGDGSQTRDFIHVSDVARANWLALQSLQSGALNIATGTPESLLALIDAIEAAGGKPARRGFKPARVGDIHASYAAVELAEAMLGFVSNVTLKEGIAGMVG
jgi:nucleoside-diphosphate-sugar epimerase